MADAPTSGLRFRIATADDVPAIVSLVRGAYRGDEARRGWTHEADLLDGIRTDAGEVSAIVAAPDRRFLLALDGLDLVACCQLAARPAGSVYFGMFAVAPRRQSAGIGRAVLAEAERFARRTWSARRMEMLVLRQRPELIAWYERRGYRLSGATVPYPYDDPAADPAKAADLEFAVLQKALR